MAQQDQFDAVIIGSGARRRADRAHAGAGRQVGAGPGEGPVVPAAVRRRPERLERLQARRADLRRSREDPHDRRRRQHRARRSTPATSSPISTTSRTSTADGNGGDHATIEGYTASVVGGGTQLYGGVSLRFSPPDLPAPAFNEGRTDLRDDPDGDVKREARDWPISYDELEPYYAKAEELVGINGTRAEPDQALPAADFYQTPLTPNPISEYAARRDGSALGDEAVPHAAGGDHRGPRAERPQGRRGSGGGPKTSYVNRYGDPLGLSRTPGCRCCGRSTGHCRNFELRANCIVTHLSSEQRHGRHASTTATPAAAGRSSRQGGRRRLLGDRVGAAADALGRAGHAEFDRRINQNDLLGQILPDPLLRRRGGA